jgi:hypothetical protein
MANQSKLKAWVRYDGTGRVIAGGPILQRFKPAVGNWVEINANECCNEITSTTTTTTTQGGGGNTPTAWIATPYSSESNACNNVASGPTLILYTSTSTIDINTTLWQDAALTQPYSPPMFNYYISFAGDSNKYGIITMTTTFINYIINCTTTTTTTSVPVFSQDVNAAYSGSGGICDGSGNPLTFYYTNQTISIGSVFYTNPGLTNLYTGQNGPYVRMYFNAQYNVVYINPNGEIATITPCP